MSTYRRITAVVVCALATTYIVIFFRNLAVYKAPSFKGWPICHNNLKKV